MTPLVFVLCLLGQSETVEEVSFDDLKEDDAPHVETRKATMADSASAGAERDAGPETRATDKAEANGTERDAGAEARATDRAEPKGTETIIEELDADALEAEGASPEYDRRPWLRALPLFALFVLAWNVDWRELRVKAETAARRAKKAPPVRKKES